MDTTARLASIAANLGYRPGMSIARLFMQAILVGCSGLFISGAMGQEEAKNKVETIPFPRGVRAPFTSAEWINDRGGLLFASEAGIYEWQLPDAFGDSATPVSGEPVEAKFNSQVDRVFDLKRSPDRESLAIAGGKPGTSGMLEVWRIRDKQLLHRWEIEGDVIYQVDWGPSSRRLVAAGANGVCSAFDVEGAIDVVEYLGHSSGVTTISVMRDERTVISGAIDQTIHLWSLETGKGIRVLDNHTAPVRCLIQGLPASDGAKGTILSASEDRTVRLWQPNLGRLVRFAKLPSGVSAMESIGIRATELGPITDSLSIAVGCDDGSLHSIDVGTLRSEQMAAPNLGRVYRLLRLPSDQNARFQKALVVVAAEGAFVCN